MTTKANVQSQIRGARFSRQGEKALKDVVTALKLDTTNTTAVIATTGGATTGLIPEAAEFVVVTCDTATKQVSLPAAVVGKVIMLFIAATGCEVISVVAAHKVNNVVVGATNEAAIPANTLCKFEYVAANTWLLTAVDNVGAVVTAIVPNAL